MKKILKYLFLVIAFASFANAGVPSLSISDNITDTTTNGNITFTFTFSESVNNFISTDITVANANKVTFTGENNSSIFTLVVTPSANFEGDVTVDVDANVATSDSTDENNTAATAIQNVDTSTPTLPSVIISSNNANNSALAKVGDEITVTISASEPLNTNSTVTIAGNELNITNTSDNNYTAKYTMQNTDTEDTIAFNITFSDSVGNSGTDVNTITTGTDVFFDKTAPSVDSIVWADSSLKMGETSLVTITFTEAILNFENNDIDFTDINGTLTAVTTTDSNTTWTATFTPASPFEDTTNTFTINISNITDNSGNALSANKTSNDLVIDTKEPT
ncbi:MAG: Ig-like domain-containing protein, partial [Arcobacteraceae bacterium]|nr:Ig-like domain-containing protein [Arcobacteraceae bacterium]